MKYTVEMKATMYMTIEIEANDPEEAEELAYERDFEEFTEDDTKTSWVTASVTGEDGYREVYTL